MISPERNPTGPAPGPKGETPVVLGRYQLLARVGCGGMGEVFEAWDPQLERRVALKLLFAPHEDDEVALREARYLARVAHPNVVCVHEIGRCEAVSGSALPPLFIAMEFVDGPDLGRWLSVGPRRWTDVMDSLLAAARGLAAVHRAGLIHGDVKPGNVLVGPDGRVRIADFGLARVRARVIEPQTLASVRDAVAVVEAELELGAGTGEGLFDVGVDFQAGVTGGTVPYMAPECLARDRPHEARADQYSLCAMAWEALYGVRPYAGRSAQSLLAAMAIGALERGRRPRGMPRKVEQVLRRGLSERPEQRWPSVDALVDALQRARTRPARVLRAASLSAMGVAGIAMACGLAGGASSGERGGQGTVRVGLVDTQASPADTRASLADTQASPVDAQATPAGPERAQAGGARARTLESDRALVTALEGIDRALLSLEEGPNEVPGLHFELLYARARLNYTGGRFGDATEGLSQALKGARASEIETRLLLDAETLLARASVLAGQCEQTFSSLEHRQGTGRDEATAMQQATLVMVSVLELLVGTGDTALMTDERCRTAHQELRGLMAKLGSAMGPRSED